MTFYDRSGKPIFENGLEPVQRSEPKAAVDELLLKLYSRILFLHVPDRERLSRPARVSQVRMSYATLPNTSVRRKSRPPCRKVSRVWSNPNRCKIVACKSCTWTSFSTTLMP